MASDPDVSRIERIQAWTYPYNYMYDQYQEYFLEGMRQHMARTGGMVAISNQPRLPKALARLRQLRYSERLRLPLGPAERMKDRLVDGLAWCLGARDQPSYPLIGRYICRVSGGHEVRVCIDAHDSGEIKSEALLQGSHIYFKTNYRIDHAYPDKVLPLYNCNHLVLPHIQKLKAMRAAPIEYDVCLIVRVWGGDNEVAGIEHCVRLLEAVARSKVNKYLLAYLVAGDKQKLAQRLQSSGIPVTMSPMPLQDLWRITSQSRVNIIRLGMHSCVPWRMSDLLALGACPILDQSPKTVWPAALREGEHFWTLDLSTTDEQPVASDSAYRAIPELLEDYIARQADIARLRSATAAYFDRNMEPERLGQHLCETVMALGGA